MNEDLHRVLFAALRLGVRSLKPHVLFAVTLGMVAATRLPAGAPPRFPHSIASPEDLTARIPATLHATKPDFTVFVPRVSAGGVSDTGNEQICVFDGPDGSLMAVWTQSSTENFQPDGSGDQHIVFSRSVDEGATWSTPRVIAGPARAGQGPIASWGFPMVSSSGRIYVLYIRHEGVYDTFFHVTGTLCGIFSDDNGETWSTPERISMRRSLRDNPDASIPPNILVWQRPLRLGRDGAYLAGFTRWTSFAVATNPTPSWMSADARVEFMRFDNLDDNPAAGDLKISWFMSDDHALAVPFPGHPETSACQEPSFVKLPDGRLFCVMRTCARSPYWSVSADAGETWTPPRPLRTRDGGEPLLHPLSPCPIYDLGGGESGSGRYVFFFHNHDRYHAGFKPGEGAGQPNGFYRRPVWIARGTFAPGADQPVRFDDPEIFMDHDGVSLGKPGTTGRADLAMYSSFTARNGDPVLWYPDRKFFLLGKRIVERSP